MLIAAMKSVLTKPGETTVTRSLSPAPWRRPSAASRSTRARAERQPCATGGKLEHGRFPDAVACAGDGDDFAGDSARGATAEPASTARMRGRLIELPVMPEDA